MTSLEEQIALLRQQVADRDQRRAEFVGTVSHDLKTPLNAIVGFTSVLLADAARLEPEQARQLRLIYDSARSLLARINDLLEFHRIEAGRFQRQAAWLQPDDLIAQLAAEHAERADEQGIQLIAEPGPEGLRIHSDANLIRRVLGELLDNAIRFGGPGQVHLRAEAPAGAEAVRFEVTDPGSGWRADRGEQLARALDPEVADLERSYEGLGLGLALAREAARLLGGAIELDASPGQSTRFALVLSLEPQSVRTNA